MLDINRPLHAYDIDKIEKGIVVRNPSNQYACENTLRISIGTAAQNKALIAAFKTMDQ